MQQVEAPAPFFLPCRSRGALGGSPPPRPGPRGPSAASGSDYHSPSGWLASFESVLSPTELLLAPLRFSPPFHLLPRLQLSLSSSLSLFLPVLSYRRAVPALSPDQLLLQLSCSSSRVPNPGHLRCSRLPCAPHRAPISWQVQTAYILRFESLILP